jgi:hypothetical protein
MNDCPNGEIRDLLPDLLHGRLDGAERERVEAHVATCELCAEELALLRDLRATMRRVPAIDVGAIAATIPPYRAPVRRSWRNTSWRTAAAIATIAIGGASIAVANRQGHPTVSAGVHMPPATTVQEPAPTTTPGAPSRQIASAPAPVPANPTSSAPAPRPSGGELAMGGAAVSDLSDRELSALLDEIETMDALPSADVESALPVTPLAPDGGGR